MDRRLRGQKIAVFSISRASVIMASQRAPCRCVVQNPNSKDGIVTPQGITSLRISLMRFQYFVFCFTYESITSCLRAC